MIILIIDIKPDTPASNGYYKEIVFYGNTATTY